MPDDIRIWEILDRDNLKEINKAKLNLEERIENWLEKDISTISSDLLVIGRQVDTDFAGVIDLLCLDRYGDVVILELKRDKTPREITAQTLDYASWVKDLSNERITELANRYFSEKGSSLEDSYKKYFGTELPETLNGEHKMLVVASEIDASSERIIRYLSDTYGVPINAATFQYFRDENGRELLARIFLIEPSQVEYSTQIKSASKRKPPLTYEELQEIAERNGVGETYSHLSEGMIRYFDQSVTTRSTVAFIGIMNGSRLFIFSLIPGESNSTQGVRFQIYKDRFANYLGVTEDKVMSILPAATEECQMWKDSPQFWVGFFKNDAEIDKFIAGLNEFKK